MSHIDYFRNIRPLTFPIDLFEREASRVVNFLHKYNGLSMNNSLLFWDVFTIFLKENIILIRLFDTSYDNDILGSFTVFQCQGTDYFGSILV